MFDKIQSTQAQEDSKRDQKSKGLASKWEMLEQRYGKH